MLPAYLSQNTVVLCIYGWPWSSIYAHTFGPPRLSFNTDSILNLTRSCDSASQNTPLYLILC